MAKLTKKSYRRKRMLMGLALFMSVALISTGFAAWVISSSVEKESNSNVQVGTISDKSIGLTVELLDVDGDKVPEDMIKFEPNKDDNSGRVRYEGKRIEDESGLVTYSSPNYESLKLSLKITVTDPSNYLDKLSIQLLELQPVLEGQEIKSEYSEVEYTNSFLYKAAQPREDGKTYIVVPEWVGDDAHIITDKLSEPDEKGTRTCTFPIEFGWGTLFDGINPGYYYDGVDANGENEDVTSDGYKECAKTVVDNLVDLRRLIYGITSLDKEEVECEGFEGKHEHYTDKYYSTEKDPDTEKPIGDWHYLNTPGPQYKIYVKAETN